jgi:hypothetical protein
MTRLRCALGPVVGVWLACLIAPMIVAPTAFWVGDQLACTCPRGADGACPMHKPAAGSTPCLVRGTDVGETAVLSSLFGLLGLVPVPTEPLDAVLVGASPPGELSPVADRSRPPDPPPPRA